jgi:hypothetical protein
MSDNMQDKMTTHALLQVVKKVQVDDGDILIIRTDSYRNMEQFGNMMTEMHPDKRILLLREQDLDIVGSLNEEQMAEFGWIKIDKNVVDIEVKDESKTN